MAQEPIFFSSDFAKGLLDEMGNSESYGELAFRFRKGKIVLYIKNETFTPTDRGTAESNRMNGASKNAD